MAIMTVGEAAKKLGMNTQTLRLGLQQNKFPFGEAILTTKAEKSSIGKERWTYHINPVALEAYLKGAFVNGGDIGRYEK